MRKKTFGFTLIELLVVITIIGILTALIMANFNAARERARDVARKSDLDQVKKALRMYYNDNNAYPDPGLLTWGSVFSSGSMIYMKRLPEDPSPDADYTYYAGVTCSQGAHDFRLVAVLENKSDQDIVKSHQRCADDCGFTWSTTNANEYVVCAD